MTLTNAADLKCMGIHAAVADVLQVNGKAWSCQPPPPGMHTLSHCLLSGTQNCMHHSPSVSKSLTPTEEVCITYFNLKINLHYLWQKRLNFSPSPKFEGRNFVYQQVAHSHQCTGAEEFWQQGALLLPLPYHITITISYFKCFMWCWITTLM